MAGLGKTLCLWVWTQWGLVWGARKGALLWFGERWTAVWGESRWLAGRPTESWTCPKLPPSRFFSPAGSSMSWSTSMVWLNC